MPLATLKTKRKKLSQPVEAYDVEVDADELCSTFSVTPSRHTKRGKLHNVRARKMDCCAQHWPSARFACSRGLFSHENITKLMHLNPRAVRAICVTYQNSIPFRSVVADAIMLTVISSSTAGCRCLKFWPCPSASHLFALFLPGLGGMHGKLH